jgi:hypothetical protein
MEDDQNILTNRRRPQYFCKGKTTRIFWQMEDNLNMLAKGRGHKFCKARKRTKLIFNWNHQFEFWEVTSISVKLV